MTRFKNELYAFLKDNDGKEIDGVVINGVEYAYRAGESETINPREWHRLYTEGRISENQYFSALGVSVAGAKKAIGTDQIEDVTIKTLSKTKSLRTNELTGEKLKDGTVLAYAEPVLKTKEQVLNEPKPFAGTGVEAGAKLNKKKRVIRVGK